MENQENEWKDFLIKTKGKSNSELRKMAFTVMQSAKEHIIDVTKALQYLDAVNMQILSIVEKYPDAKKEVSDILSDYKSREDFIEERIKITEHNFSLANKYAQIFHETKMTEMRSKGGKVKLYPEQWKLFEKEYEEGKKQGKNRANIIKSFKAKCSSKELALPDPRQIDRWWREKEPQ